MPLLKLLESEELVLGGERAFKDRLQQDECVEDANTTVCWNVVPFFLKVFRLENWLYFHFQVNLLECVQEFHLGN